jgi:hypothetical protein
MVEKVVVYKLVVADVVVKVEKIVTNFGDKLKKAVVEMIGIEEVRGRPGLERQVCRLEVQPLCMAE